MHFAVETSIHHHRPRLARKMHLNFVLVFVRKNVPRYPRREQHLGHHVAVARLDMDMQPKSSPFPHKHLGNKRLDLGIRLAVRVVR